MITILAILASLTTVGVMRALDNAKQTAIKVELDNLDAALKAYKEKYGAYPPSDLYIGPTATLGSPDYNPALRQHLYRAFPRYDQSTLRADLIAAGIDMSGSFGQRGDQALVFWLRGFNKDPTRPFLGLSSLTKAQRTTPFFEFDDSRLVTLGGGTMHPSYHPPGVKNRAPYAYFSASSYADKTSPDQVYCWYGMGLIGADAGFAQPYCEDSNGNGTFDGIATDRWVNPDTYQIISTGLDGKFGSSNIPSENPQVLQTWRLYPVGMRYQYTSGPVTTRVGYDFKGADDDNITNFCQKARLGDARP